MSTFQILWKDLSVYSPQTDFRSVEPEQRNAGLVRPRAMESIRKTFYTLCKHFSIIVLSVSRLDFHSVEPTQSKTGRVRPCPTGSICQHFIPSVNISVYFSVSSDQTSAQSSRYKERRVVSVRIRWGSSANILHPL